MIGLSTSFGRTSHAQINTQKCLTESLPQRTHTLSLLSHVTNMFKHTCIHLRPHTRTPNTHVQSICAPYRCESYAHTYQHTNTGIHLVRTTYTHARAHAHAFTHTLYKHTNHTTYTRTNIPQKYIIICKD